MTFGRDFTNAVEQKQIAQQEAGMSLLWPEMETVFREGYQHVEFLFFTNLNGVCFAVWFNR